jgi:hypothetical protein
MILMMMTELPPPQIECVGCTPAEQRVTKFLQDRGIHDKNAIATVLGNIKQESNFKHNICEGGAIVPYDQCLAGGYGLIQWTSQNRYDGLGYFATKYGGDPSDFDTQLRYMVNEPQWTRYALVLQGRGQTVSPYMHHAWYWLGWGIHGNRTTYAYDYTKKLTNVPVSLPDQVPQSTSTQSQGDIRIPFGVC